MIVSISMRLSLWRNSDQNPSILVACLFGKNRNQRFYANADAVSLLPIALLRTSRKENKMPVIFMGIFGKARNYRKALRIR